VRPASHLTGVLLQQGVPARALAGAPAVAQDAQTDHESPPSVGGVAPVREEQVDGFGRPELRLDTFRQPSGLEKELFEEAAEQMRRQMYAKAAKALRKAIHLNLSSQAGCGTTPNPFQPCARGSAACAERAGRARCGFTCSPRASRLAINMATAVAPEERSRPLSKAGDWRGGGDRPSSDWPCSRREPWGRIFGRALLHRACRMPSKTPYGHFTRRATIVGTCPSRIQWLGGSCQYGRAQH